MQRLKTNNNFKSVQQNWIEAAQADIADLLPVANDPAFYLLNGTSFASPLCASLAALVWSTNPNLTNRDVEQIMKDTAH